MAKKSTKVKTKKVQSKKKAVKKKVTKKKTTKKKVTKKKTTKKKVTKKKTTKKKVAKKKTTKKKVAKKKTAGTKTAKKAIKKKTVKRKRKKKITMDDVYKILNKVQIAKKKIVFAMFVDEANTAENIIRDVDLKYHKKVMKTQTVFTVYPKNDDDELDILDVDYLNDEIPEEGQIFG